SGHGVGLCVIGSAKLAERGANAASILARYFPGLEISTGARVVSETAPSGARGVPPTGARGMSPTGARAVSDTAPSGARVAADSGVLVSLPDDDEGERATIERQTLKARDELARVLG